jgi:hypothetical protein
MPRGLDRLWLRKGRIITGFRGIGRAGACPVPHTPVPEAEEAEEAQGAEAAEFFTTELTE